MSLLVSVAAVVVFVAFWLRYERERQVAAATIASLEERLRELTMRVDVAEHDAVAASSHAEGAESVLLGGVWPRSRPELLEALGRLGFRGRVLEQEGFVVVAVPLERPLGEPATER